MAVSRTHRPVWDRSLCLPCGACTRRCPTSMFPEQAQEPDSLRGRVARLTTLPAKRAQQPPCQRACPLSQDVPAYIQAMAARDADRAMRIIRETNPLPSVCGWICAHPCMRACVRSKLDQEVQIRELKLAAVEFSRHQPPAKPGAECSPRVAVVGSGPAGLSSAYFLRRMGYPVTVYEAGDQPGGLLRFAVPSFDLPRQALDRDIESIRAMGVEIITSTAISSPADLDKIFQEGHLAVVLAMGASAGLLPGIPGENKEGCWDAIRFANAFAKGEGSRLKGPAVVSGRGHAAAAAARVALRAGASPVTLWLSQKKRVVAAEPEGISLAEEEGVKVRVEIQAMEVRGEEQVQEVVGQSPEGSTVLPASLFVMAGERLPDLSNWRKEPGSFVRLSEKGLIEVDAGSGMTTRKGVFAAGEVQSGMRDSIRSMASGKKAAEAVDRFLRDGDGS